LRLTKLLSMPAVASRAENLKTVMAETAVRAGMGAWREEKGRRL
jgi:hypothetical protein